MSVAGVAHPVERHLAKVEVASSSLVTRSINAVSERKRRFFFLSTIFQQFLSSLDALCSLGMTDQ